MNKKIDPESLLASITAEDGNPAYSIPIDSWDPPFCGEMDMRISADGNWYYRGNRVTREGLIRLFSSILRRESDHCYYLVTPVEKVRIQVEDVPFLVVDSHLEGSGANRQIWLTTNVGDQVPLNSQHYLYFQDGGGRYGVVPYVIIRKGLAGRLSRNLYYQLVSMAEQRRVAGKKVYGVVSDEVFFPLEPGAGSNASDL